MHLKCTLTIGTKGSILCSSVSSSSSGSYRHHLISVPLCYVFVSQFVLLWLVLLLWIGVEFECCVNIIAVNVVY